MALVLLLVSCGSIPRAQRETPFGEGRAIPPRYSIVCIIHGDGDYLYFDARGHACRADEEALGRATLVAAHNPQAEVFIFHQKHRRHALFFYPLRDGKFYYYRNGRLLAEEAYWRDTGVELFYRPPLFVTPKA